MTAIDPRDSITYNEYVSSMTRYVNLHTYELMRMSHHVRMDHLIAEADNIISDEFINAHVSKKEWFSQTKEDIVSSICEDAHDHFLVKADAFIKNFMGTRK